MMGGDDDDTDDADADGDHEDDDDDGLDGHSYDGFHLHCRWLLWKGRGCFQEDVHAPCRPVLRFQAFGGRLSLLWNAIPYKLR